jgi:hypothetical protein
MLKFIKSACEPERLFPRILVVDNNIPAFAPPNGTVLVRAVNGPALLEIWKSAEGILWPAPSVRAVAELAKNAYTFTLPTLGFSAQAVVAVMLALPGLLAFPGVRVKFTALLDNDRLSESFRTACSVMVLAPEFRTCASERDARAANASTNTTPTHPVCSRKLIASVPCRSALQTAPGRDPSSPPYAVVDIETYVIACA